MASAKEKNGRVVFIGNMDYNVSEEQVIDLFRQCGTVVSFRMVYDKDTARSKGFGFLEYRTADEAETARRNLNNFVWHERTLKVDYSNDNGAGGKKVADIVGPATSTGSALPTLPPGVGLAPGLTAPDAISQTISNIPTPQLLDILSQMKALVTSDPAKATALLGQAPQLAYALFQALMLMGLANTDILSALVTQVQQAPAAPVAPPSIQYQQPAQPGYPMYPPQPGFMPVQQQYATPPPQQAYAPPPVPTQAAYSAPPGMDAGVIEAVKNLTAAQFATLEEGARNEIMRLRASLGMPPIPPQ